MHNRRKGPAIDKNFVITDSRASICDNKISGAITPVERVEIAPGYSISRLLKGGWHLSSRHNEAVDRDRVIADIAAFEAGFTSFGCADHHLGVEQMIGDFRRGRPHLARKLQIHAKYVPDRDLLPNLKRAATEGTGRA